MSTEHTRYEIFLSYARKDNTLLSGAPADTEGWVTALRNHILEDHRRFSTEPLRIFFDVHEIRDMDDWQHRILGALRHSKILLVCLSPAYFGSPYCRWEWDEYLRRQVHQHLGADSIATVYFVEAPGSGEQDNARWLASVMQGNFTDIRPWFPEGSAALQREEVRRRMAVLGQSLWERIQRARRAEGVPGNLRRQNPYFVGRREELRKLHEHLSTGAVGLVTAVHGLGGQGKTELAVAYAHGWADHYPAGLWVLAAEHRQELLPLIGELAYAPEFGYQPTDAEKKDPSLLGRTVLAELQRRVSAIRQKDPHSVAAALIILDNVSQGVLLLPEQLAQLPRTDWLRLIATTRLDAVQLDPAGKSLAHIAVDSLAENDALALIRDHQEPRDAQGRLFHQVTKPELKDFIPRFASVAEEAAALEIVRELGAFTLAVEQVAVYLGLHPEITPRAYLAGLRANGLPSVDQLGAKPEVQARLLHQQKQLAVVLEASLALLDAPALTALHFAAGLPPDHVPWPWLEALTRARHPELADFAPDEPNPWVAVRRRLEGLRLLTAGDHPELARLHRLIAAHLGEDSGSGDPSARQSLKLELEQHLASRADAISDVQILPDAWELDALLVALPSVIARPDASRYAVNMTVFLTNKVTTYRGLPEALRLLRPAHEYLNRTAQADPGNAGWQRDLSVSFNQIGDVLRDQGDLPNALKAFRDALAIAQRLAQADPGNAGWQRDLSVSFNQIGDVLRDQGDLPNALKAFRDALAIRQRLAQADPGNAGWQRDLSVSWEKIGDVLRDQGDLPNALKAFRDALAIRQRLAQADPGNAGWQRDLSVSFNKIGDVLRDQGDLPNALKAFRDALAIRQRLAQADPGNAGWQRDLSVSFNHIGDVLRDQGDLPNALKAFRDALAIRQRLAQADPGNAGWQRDLSVSWEKIGDVLRDQGDLPNALKAFRDALAIRQRLAQADPGNAGWQRDLSVSWEKIGDVLRDQGDLPNALKAFRDALAIRQRLAQADPGNAGWQCDLAASFQRLAGMAASIGNRTEASEHFASCHSVINGMKAKGMHLDRALAELLAGLERAAAENYASLVAMARAPQPAAPPSTPNIPDPSATPRRKSSIEELRESADQNFQKGLWEAAATHLGELLERGEIIEQVAPKLITCLLNAREHILSADAVRVETLLSQLESTSHAALAAPLRQQLKAKLGEANPKKPWWKIFT